MRWFRRSSFANNASQHREKTKSTAASAFKAKAKQQQLNRAGGMAKSSSTVATLKMADKMKTLSALEQQLIEVVDPEIFFQDPEHIRNYREEEAFLQLMSEWEIVENPAAHDRLNYFSADFEEELLQRRTQDCGGGSDAQLNATNSGADSEHAEMKRQQQQQMQEQQQKREEEEQMLELRFKRDLYELLFSGNIQMGIALPMPRRKGRKRKHKNASASADNDDQCPPATDASSTAPPTYIIKDCHIDRSQLKTEALARSIMGAIGKCPAKDGSITEIVKAQQPPIVDLCQPSSWLGCDHYDIMQFFRLDDNGNILLNISHIEESKGFGFTVAAQNKRLYRRYLKEVHTVEEFYRQRGGNRGCCACWWQLWQLIWSLMCAHPRNKINHYGSGPGDSVRAYTLQLALDQTSTFARNIENFICCTKDSREAAPQVVMRNMRQFMNGMKNYLVKHGEGKFQQEVEAARSHLKSDEFLNLDAILETVMHQLVVLPLREHLYGMFVDYYTRSEDIQLLAQNVKYACGRSAADFGIRPTVTPPSPTSLHVISNLLLRLQEAELPLDKLDLFLCVVSTVFDATGCPRGQQLGADDFLPVLVYVVAKCGFVGAEIEAEFMWGLLQPTLLNGEPGYYLTALCSAVHVLKSFMASENESGSGSLDWRSSSLPACSSVLRVIIPDECNGSLQTRTLPVRPHTTTREVCRIIAHKARITNPQDYALFKLVDGEETLLSDAECPQDIRLAAKGKHCMLAYKRIDAKIAWPTIATQSASSSSSSHYH